MDKITELLNNFSLEKYIPKLDTLTGWVQWLISLAIRIGPICILVLGLIYLLIPPKEANHKAGYRTYFGMGSIVAWRFTQRVAGAIMTVTGLILTIIAYNTLGKFPGMDLMSMAQTAFDVIKVQVILALIIHIFMFLLTAVLFNRKGICRFERREHSLLDKLLPKEEFITKPVQVKEVQKEKIPQEAAPQIPEPEYERQGEQVITADDIVIEGLD